MKYRRRILKNRNYKRTSRKKQITKTPALGHKIASWSTRRTDRPQLDQTNESLYVDNTKATKTEEPKVPTDELIETKETNTDTSSSPDPNSDTETSNIDDDIELPNPDTVDIKWLDDALTLFSSTDYTIQCTKNDIFGVYMCQCRDCKIQAKMQDELHALPTLNLDNCMCKYTLTNCMYQCTKNDIFGVYMCKCCDCKIKAKMQF